MLFFDWVSLDFKYINLGCIKNINLEEIKSYKILVILYVEWGFDVDRFLYIGKFFLLIIVWRWLNFWGLIKFFFEDW